MKREYIQPATRLTEQETSYRGGRPGLGDASKGATVMHTNDSFFEEDTDEENWAQVGNLWDE